MECAVHVVPACYTTMSHDGHMIITPLMAISSHRCKLSKKKVGLVCILLLADSPSILFLVCPSSSAQEVGRRW